MAGANRYVDLSAKAVFGWLTRPDRDAERDLVERLLALDPNQPLPLERLATALGLTVPELGKRLFALNREMALEIRTEPPRKAAAPGLVTALREELVRLAPARGAVVLSLDGLLLAARGCDAALAERVAAGRPGDSGFRLLANLHFQEGNVAIFTTTGLDESHGAWVGLARRFLSALGALSFGKSP